MRNEWSATTLFMTIQKLKQIARHLAPSTNFKWLSDIAGDLRAEDGPVKNPPVVDASELLIAGLAFVEEYMKPERPMDMRSALNIRNGLMVAMLASCPIRAKNLTGLTLGRSLHLSNSCWWIDLQGSETKNGRPDTRMIPEFLAPALESYLREARPVLLTGRDPRVPVVEICHVTAASTTISRPTKPLLGARIRAERAPQLPREALRNQMVVLN